MRGGGGVQKAGYGEGGWAYVLYFDTNIWIWLSNIYNGYDDFVSSGYVAHIITTSVGRGNHLRA